MRLRMLPQAERQGQHEVQPFGVRQVEELRGRCSFSQDLPDGLSLLLPHDSPQFLKKNRMMFAAIRELSADLSILPMPFRPKPMIANPRSRFAPNDISARNMT